MPSPISVTFAPRATFDIPLYWNAPSPIIRPTPSFSVPMLITPVTPVNGLGYLKLSVLLVATLRIGGTYEALIFEAAC